MTQLSFNAEDPAVQELFDYWFKAMRKRRAVLGASRRARLTWALRHYSLSECKLAVDGCLLDSKAMGHAGRRKYNDILDIFETEGSIERFIEIAEDVDDDASPWR